MSVPVVRRGERRLLRLVPLLVVIGCDQAPAESRPPALSLGSAQPNAATAPRSSAPPAATRGGWLGMRMEAAPTGGGARVAEIVPSTPADLEGLEVGDLIVAIDGVKTESPGAVNDALEARPIGSPFELEARRGERPVRVRLALEPMPSPDELVRRRFIGKRLPALDSLEPAPGSKAKSQGWMGRRATVLEFWASWCGTCRVLSGTLNEWNDHHAKRGVRVIGVTRESPDIALPTANGLMNYEVAFDRDGALSTALDVQVLPTVFLVDERGEVRDVVRGLERRQLERIERWLDGL